MTKLSAWKKAYAVFVLCAAMAIAVQAQTFRTLVRFNGANGAQPYYMQLTQGADNSLYGTTDIGGAYNAGTVFKITARGTLITLYSFCAQPNCTDGSNPYAGLVQSTDGNFYGTSYEGGDHNYGTVFKVTPSGTLTTLHSFDGTDGAYPYAGLVQAMNGDFYGTTSGEAPLGPLNDGTVFKITADGALTTLHRFTGPPTDGAIPLDGIILGTDGNFYGTTAAGGNIENFCGLGCGTVFKMTPAGAVRLLYSFCPNPYCLTGSVAYGLIESTDGSLYGTTQDSGPNGPAGTVFKISPQGGLSLLYGFCSQPGCADGYEPGELIQATDGNFYGTTSHAGADNYGTVFKITADGTLTTLHSFDNTDGGSPYGGLVQGTDGSFYGTTTFYGGPTCGCCGCGTVFSLSTGLGPFVAFVHGYGRVGRTFGILGQGFTGTTSVSLNGIPASFTVVSDTFIKATVPAGATTGYVTVTTSTGVLTSNVPFHVIP